MGVLGIALFPPQTTYEEDCAYLALAKTLGYKRVFISLLTLDLKQKEAHIKRIRESITQARKEGFQIFVDVHPLIFQYLHLEPNDISYFHQMGVDGIRLDAHFTGREEAELTHNPYGMKIEINMSNDTSYVNHILDQHPNKTLLYGCHNFFPQRYTGLSTPHFKACTKRFKDLGIHTAAFLNAQSSDVAPWPNKEGLCTLEEHRSRSVSAQILHYRLMGGIDDLLFANTLVKEAELIEAKKAFETQYPTLHYVLHKELSQTEQAILNQLQHYRGDVNAYSIRSCKARGTLQDSPLPPHDNRAIKRGDILILNELYGPYKGELQIALQDREVDEKINIVGNIVEDEIFLLDDIRANQSFLLERK